MKKLLLAIAVAIVSMTASAQTAKMFNWGVEAGMNFNSLSFDKEMFESGNRAGFFVGPMAKFTIPVLGLGIEADALYSRSGAEVAGEKINKNSIEIPVYLRYDFALPLVSKVAVPFLAVGPQFGFAFGSTDEVIKNLGKYEYKKSNLSLNLGAGAILLSKIQLHINYNIALGKTSEWSGIDGVADGMMKVMDSKTNTWQISAAYLF